MIFFSNLLKKIFFEKFQSFLHLTKPLSAGDVYITLSRFPDDVVRKAYTSLKLCGIIVQMKVSLTECLEM